MERESRAAELLATSSLPQGDPQRLGTLLAALEPRLMSVALRFTRDPEAARDVVQSAFEKVIRHGASFHGRSRVSTWVHRIVVNEALMWLRAERRRGRWIREDSRRSELEVADPAPGPADELARRERESRLRDGIASLAREEREVVTRCGLGGLSYAEYGARTGLHPAAVKSRAFRARRRLSGLLTGT